MLATLNIKAIILSGFSLLASVIALRAEDHAPKETPLFVTGRNFESMDDRIFPLGWSADGKFAWICKQSNEAADECTWRLTIQDMGTNKVLATEKFEMPDTPENGIARLWDSHGKAVAALLKEHAVKRTSQEMDHFPLVLGHLRSSVFQPVLETVTGTHEDLQFVGVKSFQIFRSAGDRNAALFERKFDGYLFPFSVWLCGCFVSPDEAHAAIVITACWRGWEGAPHPRRIEALAGYRTGLGD